MGGASPLTQFARFDDEQTVADARGVGDTNVGSMKTQVTQKVFVGAGFTIRHVSFAQSRRKNADIALGKATHRFGVLCVLVGCVAWRTSSAEGILDEQDALLLAPDENVTLRTDSTALERAGELVFISLEPSLLLEAALRHNFINREAALKLRAQFVADDARLSRVAGDLRDELASESRGQNTYVSALVEQLIIHLLRKHATFPLSPALELSRVGLVDRRIRRALELMHTHMERDLSLEELAAAAYLSSFHFARLFKKLTGTSPHAYLAAVRMAKAESLLAETDLTITEISQHVGYGSPSHFAKAFRKATGFSPRTFRQSLVHKS